MPGTQGPGYTREVPPGGWQQPPAVAPAVPWAGRLAGWWSRVGAAIVDWLIVLVPAVVVMTALGLGVVATSGDSDAGFWALVGATVLTLLAVIVISFIYAPLTMMRQGACNGQTWGKQLVGIRVIRTSGEPMGFAWAALREVVVKNVAMWMASFFIPILPWLVNYLWPLWDDENRALHDFAVDTRVVRD